MDTKNLKIGKYANYRALCNILNESVKTGGSKVLQLRNWDGYFEWEKDKNAFVVTKIYDKPKPCTDGRIGNTKNKKYANLIDDVIIESLIKNKTFIATYNQFMIEYVPVLSKKYLEIYDKPAIFADQNEMSKGLVKTYLEKSRSITQKALESSLDRLYKKGIINYKKQRMIRMGDVPEEATDDIEKAIDLVESLTYSEMGITHVHRINKTTNQAFKKNVCRLISKDLGLPFFGYYQVYNVSLNYVPESLNPDLSQLKSVFASSIEKSVSNKTHNLGNGEFKAYQTEKQQESLRELSSIIFNLNALPF